MNKEFDYIVIGAGIAGCCLAYFLSKYSKSILLIDRNSQVAFGASGAAGAFLSPLLGKPNDFKDLVTKSLIFSTNFYKNLGQELISNCGVCRIPKNQEDSDKIKKIELALNKSKLEDESDFFEFEIEINDRLIQPNEKYIVEIFPRYREYLNLKREYFYDQDGTYSMKIDFIDNKGNLEFIFENEKLISIVINYIY